MCGFQRCCSWRLPLRWMVQAQVQVRVRGTYQLDVVECDRCEDAVTSTYLIPEIVQLIVSERRTVLDSQSGSTCFNENYGA